MTKPRTALASAGIAALLMTLAGCAQPSGPVFGEWRSETPGRSRAVHKTVDVVLYGAPGASSGTYHIASTEHDPTAVSGNGTQQWTGTWVRSSRADNGRDLTIITLENNLPDEIDAYALMPDDRLHALDPDGMLDTTPAGALYTLSPVPPGARG